MSIMPHLPDTELSPKQEDLVFLGVFESSATIYPSALALTSLNDPLKQRLKRQFGGTIEADGNRWIVRSPKTRRVIYRWWAERSMYRRAEIEAALDSLGSA